MSFKNDALLHKLQDEADKWEEVPDEDLWEDGELSLLDVMHKIEDKLLVEGDWKLIRRKENDNRKKKK